MATALQHRATAARRKAAAKQPERLVGGAEETDEDGVATREGITYSSRTTYQDWMTIPVETLVERRVLGMSLQQLELRCTSNTVHYVLNLEPAKDSLLTSNDLKRVLSKTPKFSSTPVRLPLSHQNV